MDGQKREAKRNALLELKRKRADKNANKASGIEEPKQRCSEGSTCSTKKPVCVQDIPQSSILFGPPIPKKTARTPTKVLAQPSFLEKQPWDSSTSQSSSSPPQFTPPTSTFFGDNDDEGDDSMAWLNDSRVNPQLKPESKGFEQGTLQSTERPKNKGVKREHAD
ncbi:MAG: hypothetical protein M1822_000808 [Bathelium mastoideum]|nr:MAG: hypothetical protein M1822_000808 [Bathelium mastoideum]